MTLRAVDHNVIFVPDRDVVFVPVTIPVLPLSDVVWTGSSSITLDDIFPATIPIRMSNMPGARILTVQIHAITVLVLFLALAIHIGAKIVWPYQGW